RDLCTLIGFREAVHGFRVDDGPQCRFALGDYGGEPSVAPEIAPLSRVGLQVEEHGWQADVVYVLVAAAADHERTGWRPRRVVLRQYRALRRAALADIEQRRPRKMAIAGVGLQSRALDDRRERIGQGDRYRAYVAGRYVGAAHDERYARRLLVHRRFAPQAARAEVVAVIGRVNDARLAGEPARFQRVQYLADVVVEKGYQPEIGRQRTPDHRRIERLVEA